MRVPVEQRHERILDIVRRRGRLRITALAEELGISPVTLRRDVEVLAADGRILRAHGSVSWPDAHDRVGPGAVPDVGATDGHGLTLGLMVPNADYYYPEVTRGAQAAAAAAGARLVLGLTFYQPEQDAVQIRRLLDGGVDGLLVTPTWDTGTAQGEEAQRVLDLGVPTVLVERRAEPGSPAADLDRVCSDHVHGAALAVRHLAALGHEQILVATDRRGPTGPALAVGVEAARVALGLPEPIAAPVLLDHGDASSQGAAVQAFERALERGVRAAIILNDTHAIMLSQLLMERGVRIPEDLALVAYDDVMAELADVPLTAVAPPKHAVGEAAVQLLMRRIAAERSGAPFPARHVDLLPTLRVRASSGARPEPSGND